MIQKTKKHLHHLPDIPRYVIIIPVIAKRGQRRQFLLEQFRTAYPRRYKDFYHRYRHNAVPFKWFDVYRADPFAFQPHIVVAGIQRSCSDGYARSEDVEFVFKAVADWMKSEMPLVKDLCIAMPVNIRMSNTVARVAKKLFADDRDLRVHLFGRAKNVNRSYVC